MSQAESNVNDIETATVGSNLILTPEGIDQATRTADGLHKLAQEGIIAPLPDLNYSSPYRRVLQTAQVLAAVLDKTIEIDPRLQEIQKGDWHGQKVVDVMAFEAAVDASERPYFKAPGGEKWSEVAKRMNEFIHEKLAAGARNLLIVSHNHPIEISAASLSGLPIYDWKDRPVSNASASRLVSTKNTWSIDDEIYNRTF